MEIKRYEVRGTKYIFFALVLLISYFTLFSCAPKQDNPPPPDLIDEKEMASVICDLTLSEAILTGQPLAEFNDTLRKINVLKEHKLNNRRFLSSFKYYSKDPAKLKTIYADAQHILNERQGIKDTIPVK